MASTERKRLYKVESDSITLFGLEGSRDGRRWMIGMAISAATQSYIPVFVGPFPALEDLMDIIGQDAINGDYDRIKSVAMSARVAVRLFLEGVIKPEHFHLAEENTMETGRRPIEYIYLPAVPFGDHNFPVYVFSEWEVGSSYIATWDEDNNVV